jgi:hypothetical protein
LINGEKESEVPLIINEMVEENHNEVIEKSDEMDKS